MRPVPELASEPHRRVAAAPRPDPQQGVFETLLVLDGHPVERDAHLARLTRSLSTLFPDRPAPNLTALDVPVERGPYGPLSTGTSDKTRVEVLRIAVAPGRDRGLEAGVERRQAPPGAFMSLCDMKAPGRPVGLGSFELPGGLGPHKWTDRSLLEAAQTDLPEGTLPLIVDRGGAVLEASRANVFAVRDGALFTPPLDGRILPGVTRARVLQLAAAAGVDTREEELGRDDLLAADEVFLTGSVRGIERVGSLDGTELASRGGVASRLARELRRAWRSGQLG
jgi:para-aminobenzoate synthetase / 4-amino-4-deoxychorismate lyase